MTDPVSITASIVSLAAVSVQVAILAEGFVSNYRNAPAEVLKLASEMQAMGTVLGRLAEYSRNPGLSVLLPQQLVDDLCPILDSCMVLFERAEGIVMKLNKGMLAGSVLARLRWLVKEKELEKLRNGISEHKLTLNMTLAVASCLATHQVHVSMSRIEAHNNEILDKINQLLLSQVSEELANISNNSNASSLIMRRFLDDITSYAGSLCTPSRQSTVIMRRCMNDQPEIESILVTSRASFDQYNASVRLDSTIEGSPIEFSPGYMANRKGSTQSLEAAKEKPVGIFGPGPDSCLSRSHLYPDDGGDRIKQSPQRSPVSPSFPNIIASRTSALPLGGHRPAFVNLGKQLPVLPKREDGMLAATLDSGICMTDDTPTSVNRFSFDDAEDVLHLADPGREAGCGTVDDNGHRILRVHERKVPIIKVPVPLCELEAHEPIIVPLQQKRIPVVKVPIPTRPSTGAVVASEEKPRQRLKICTGVSSISHDSLLQGHQEKAKIVRLSPTETWRLPHGWEFGGRCSPGGFYEQTPE